MKKYQSIPQWAEDDRPREKLIKHGRSVLSNAELLAILLGSGHKEKSAIDVAKEVLNFYDNNFNKLGRASVQELCSNFKGIGSAKAVTILATMEIAARKVPQEEQAIKITDSESAYLLFARQMTDLPHEEFWIALLTNANKVLALKRLSAGGKTGTVVDKTLLLKMTVEHAASAIILCHNHPSGTLEPSASDHKITQDIKTLCQLLDVRLLDHIIIGTHDYLSFADEEIL